MEPILLLTDLCHLGGQSSLHIICSLGSLRSLHIHHMDLHNYHLWAVEVPRGDHCYLLQVLESEFPKVMLEDYSWEAYR